MRREVRGRFTRSGLGWPLASKRLPDGGFPLEAPTTLTADHVTSRGSSADWGPSGLRRSNPLVTLAALDVLHHPPHHAA